ncbi:MAG: amino acid ABC transporter permease, partial [Rhodobacteraceae bacterium]|nr:amino acid ABC transporter permease [Paracoccaceae bacterium]
MRLEKLINDTKFRGLFFQVLLGLSLVLAGHWLFSNTVDNLTNQGKTLGFDFLSRTSGFQIIPT